jgi:hypothetical protein
VVDTNLNIQSVSDDRLTGYGRTDEPFVLIEKGGRQYQLTTQAETSPDPLVLEGDWEFQTETANALVIGKWLAKHETPGTNQSAYTKTGVDTKDWQPMVPGAWSYQLPAEPEAEYPIPVWYRISFQADYIPPQVSMIVDGFAGSDWSLFVNGESVKSVPTRSQVDAQMKAVDITSYLQKGENLITLRLVVTHPTDGLLDLLKLTGEFSLAPQSDGAYRIQAPCQTLQPLPWTHQGYPYFSGRAVYRTQFELPESFNNQRVFLEPEMEDDVLDVLVNGQSAGIRLWAPYPVEVTEFLKAGENTLELRVANTLVNMLEAVERPSGLGGAPKLVPYQTFSFDLTEG